MVTDSIDTTNSLDYTKDTRGSSALVSTKQQIKNEINRSAHNLEHLIIKPGEFKM